MPAPKPDPDIDRILRHLDEQDVSRDDPLVVPAWAGPPHTTEPEIRIMLREGKVLVQMSPAFAQAVRLAAKAAAALEPAV